MDWKIILYVVLALVIGCVLGAIAFPTTVTNTVTETVVEYVDVPGETITVIETVELPVEVENTERIDALTQELEVLVERYEQLTDERYDADEIDNELRFIEKAKEDLEGDYKFELLRGDYLLSEIEVQKYYSESVKVLEVKRWVDGKKIDYDQATVKFEVKVAYEDDEGLEYRRFDVEVSYDIDRDGDEEVEVSVWLV